MHDVSQIANFDAVSRANEHMLHIRGSQSVIIVSLSVGDADDCFLLPPITPIWYCSMSTPSIHPYAVSPDLLNLWLDSMFISPLEPSLDIRWCTIATQSVAELSRKVQLIQTPADVAPRLYSMENDWLLFSICEFTHSINNVKLTIVIYHWREYFVVLWQLCWMAVHFVPQQRQTPCDDHLWHLGGPPHYAAHFLFFLASGRTLWSY